MQEKVCRVCQDQAEFTASCGRAGIRNQTSQGHGMGCHHTHANLHPARNFKKGVYEMLWLCVMAVLNNAMFDEH